MERYRMIDPKPSTASTEPVGLYGKAALRFLEEVFGFTPVKEEAVEVDPFLQESIDK